MFSTNAVNAPVPMTAPLLLAAAGVDVCPLRPAFNSMNPPHTAAIPNALSRQSHHVSSNRALMVRRVKLNVNYHKGEGA